MRHVFRLFLIAAGFGLWMQAAVAAEDVGTIEFPTSTDSA